MTEHALQILEPDDTPPLMHPDASGDAICAYLPCSIAFKAKKSWQLYCCAEHRRLANALKADGALRGVVKSNKLLKGGKHSVTFHFEAADDVSHLQPGRVMEIL
jgi:hypothetical protein